jgi:hypothetical protein
VERLQVLVQVGAPRVRAHLPSPHQRKVVPVVLLPKVQARRQEREAQVRREANPRRVREGVLPELVRLLCLLRK